MANLTGGTIAASDTDYNLPQASMDITTDIIDLPYLKVMRKYGIINDQSITASTKGKMKGDLVKMPNVNRLNSQGNDPAQSQYTQAKTLEYGVRELRLQEYKDSVVYDREEAMSRQRDTHELLAKYDKQMLSQNAQHQVLFGLFQHLGGNTSTSYTNPMCSDVAYTGSTLLRSRLLTATVAPTSQYFGYGSLNAAGHTNPSTIDPTNTRLTFQDLQKAANVIENVYAGISMWQRLATSEACAVLWVSKTGFTQLVNQSQASGSATTIQAMRDAAIAGGKSLDTFGGLTITYLPIVDILMVVVPDALMPRAQNGGTENTNSRLAIITGKGALDFAIGNAYGGGELPSFKLDVDDTTNKLDDKITIGLRGIFAGKKVQLNGSGVNAGNLYDAATYVIAHSA